MAKKLVYKRKIEESITAKGTLDETATILTYVDDEDIECTVTVQELLNKFAEEGVSITIKKQSDEELDLEGEAEEIDIEDLESDNK